MTTGTLLALAPSFLFTGAIVVSMRHRCKYDRIFLTLSAAFLVPLVTTAFAVKFPRALDAMFTIYCLIILSTALLLLIVSSLSAAIRGQKKRGITFSRPGHQWLTGVSLALLAALIVISSLGYVANPANSWDGLSWWLPESAKLINSQSPSAYIEQYDNRHPNLLIVLRAWTASSLGILAQAYIPSATNFYLHLIYASLIFTYSLKYTRSATLSSITTAIGISVPLLENHAHLVGYAELSMCVLFFIGFCSALLYFERRDIASFLVSASAFTLLCFTRNTGFLYVAASGLALLLSLLVFRRMYLSIILLAVSSLAIFFILLPLLSNDYDYEHCILAFNPSDGILCIAGRNELIGQNSFSLMVENIMHSWIVKQSFGTSLILIAACVGSALLGNPQDRAYNRVYIFWVINSFIIVSLMLFASQALDYIFHHSIPTRDTSFSRSFIPILSLIPILFVTALRNLCSQPRQ